MDAATDRGETDKTEMRIDNLIDEAEAAQERAHVPYSGFSVGAALLTADGTVYSACNVEAKPSANTLHAEQRAMAKAVEAGHKDFDALALITSSSERLPPCGNCRQTLATFQEDLLIIVANDDGKDYYRLNDLLPNAYTGRKMEDAPTEG